MKIRFTANDGNTQSIVEAGVDGVLVSRLECDDGEIGTRFCFGDGSGAFCPCFNQGQIGNGCENGLSTGGAHLLAMGTTSPDTVLLTSSNELPSALTIFLQGTQSMAAVPYGNGLRCIGGVLKRLYNRNAVNGTVSAPQGADLSITARSAALNHPILPGQLKFYMTYSRDPNPNVCTGLGFNSSNALGIVW